MNIPDLLPEIARSLTHLLLPQLCTGCRIPLLNRERVLCMGCLLALPMTGSMNIPDNEAAMRLAGRIPFRQAAAALYFEPDGLLQHLLHLLKYRGRKDVGRFLGRQAGFALQGASWMGSVDVLVPVPLHPRKEAARGYNQAALIAKGLAEVFQLPVAAEVLKRIRYTESQTKKSREDRILNVAHAFKVAAEAGLSGKHVLLIDDVLTTGATLEAAAKPLLQLPGCTISVLTIGLAMS